MANVIADIQEELERLVLALHKAYKEQKDGEPEPFELAERLLRDFLQDLVDMSFDQVGAPELIKSEPEDAIELHNYLQELRVDNGTLGQSVGAEAIMGKMREIESTIHTVFKLSPELDALRERLSVDEEAVEDEPSVMEARRGMGKLK